jgi:diguanylate cyclase (GGDEF)-like protein
MLLGWGGAHLTRGVDDWGEALAALAGAVPCAVAARRRLGAERWAWALIGLSALSWGLGEIVWSWYETLRGIAVPFPSAADAGYLTAVPLEVAGVVLLAERAGVVSRSRTVLEGLIVAAALFYVSWVSVLGPVASAPADSKFALALSIAYPLGDIITGTIAVSVLVGARRLELPLVLIVLAMAALATSDSTFTYLTSKGAYQTNPVDTGWFAGYLLVGLAGWRAAARSDLPARPLAARGLSRARILLPYLILVAAVVLAAEQFVSRVRFDIPEVVALAGLVGLVLIRQLVALTEVQRLSRELERTVQRLREREQQLEFQAFHDSLTGLANRVLFRDRIAHALARGRNVHAPIAVMFLDLDDFKTVNDRFGHEAGDALLVAVAKRLEECVRPGDTVARLGGDEFAVLLEEIRLGPEAEAVAARILTSLKAPIDLVGGLEVTVSIGIVTAFETPAASVTDLLRGADIAMYAAKRAGKSGFRLMPAPVG